MSIRDWYRSALQKDPRPALSSGPKSLSPVSVPPQYLHSTSAVPIDHQNTSANGVPVGQTDALTVSGAMKFYHPSSSGTPVPSVTAKSLPTGVSAARGPRVRFHDPLSLIYATGFRDRRFSLTYETLRRVSYQLSLLNAIILTRTNQVASFSKPFRKNRQLGFEIRYSDERHVPNEAERIAIERLEQYILDCGWGPNPYTPFPRDDFETFIKKFVRDSLTYDQSCFEIVPDEDGRPFEFRAVDASTIRLGATYDGYRGTEPRKFKVGRDFSEHWSKEYGEDFEFDGESVFTVQVMHGRIENIFTLNDMAFCLRNPRSDIWVSGYGFCLHPDSRVSTSKGLIRVEDLDDRTFEVVISGKNIPARAFKTGKRRSFELIFEDGRSVKASQDHRFYVLSPEGAFEWKRLEAISSGDVVASDLSVSEGGLQDTSFSCDTASVYNAGLSPWKIETTTEDLWEVVGRLVGSGRFQQNNRGDKSVFLFYSPEEKDLSQKHLRVFDDYSVPFTVSLVDKGHSHTVYLDHVGFCEWLKDVVGFSPVTAKSKPNGLPERVFTLPFIKRCAFLRGLFSIEGYFGSSGTPYLRNNDPEILSDVQRLLWSIGIRSRWDRQVRNYGQGSRAYNDNRLWVHDKVLFCKYIGVTHPHQQPVLEEAEKLPKEASQRSAFDSDFSLRGEKDAVCFKEPCWHYSVVKDVVDTGETIEMYDVTVNDEFHGFVVDGVVVHNSETEMCLSTVLRMLWAEDYNSRIFRQGSMANGILNFKGDNLEPTQLEAFRRIWQAHVAGVENCLHGDTQIWTKDGRTSLEEYLGGRSEKPAIIWTGDKWAEGRVFETKKPKQLCHTKLGNGVTVSSSPDHKFRVLGPEGLPVWKRQQELHEGDFVLVNKNKVSYNSCLPSYKGKQPIEEKDSCSNKSSRIALETTLLFLRKSREAHSLLKCFTPRELMDISEIQRGERDCSVERLVGFMEKARVEVPSWLTGYHFEPVVFLERTEEFIQMYDVEMFTEEHCFMGNGVYLSNSHRMPIVQIPEGVEFVSLQRGNKEMEYRAWLDYLLKIVSGTFQIDPAEINFDLVGGGGGKSAPLFESKHEWKLKHSKDKGLRPLLEFVAKQINKYIIRPLDPALYFDFVGLDRITENDRVELNTRKASSYMTLNEVRQEEGLNPVVGGDIILNPIYLQSVQLPPGVLGGSRVGTNPLSPWLTEGENSPPDYGDAVAVPLYMQEGGDEEMASFQIPEDQPGMPPGGGAPGGPIPPPGVPPGAQPGPGMVPPGGGAPPVPPGVG